MPHLWTANVLKQMEEKDNRAVLAAILAYLVALIIPHIANRFYIREVFNTFSGLSVLMCLYNIRNICIIGVTAGANLLLSCSPVKEKERRGRHAVYFNLCLVLCAYAVYDPKDNDVFLTLTALFMKYFYLSTEYLPQTHGVPAYFGYLFFVPGLRYGPVVSFSEYLKWLQMGYMYALEGLDPAYLESKLAITTATTATATATTATTATENQDADVDADVDAGVTESATATAIESAGRSIGEEGEGEGNVKEEGEEEEAEDDEDVPAVVQPSLEERKEELVLLEYYKMFAKSALKFGFSTLAMILHRSLFNLAKSVYTLFPAHIIVLMLEAIGMPGKYLAIAQWMSEDTVYLSSFFNGMHNVNMAGVELSGDFSEICAGWNTHGSKFMHRMMKVFYTPESSKTKSSRTGLEEYARVSLLSYGHFLFFPPMFSLFCFSLVSVFSMGLMHDSIFDGAEHVAYIGKPLSFLVSRVFFTYFMLGAFAPSMCFTLWRNSLCVGHFFALLEALKKITQAQNAVLAESQPNEETAPQSLHTEGRA
ncbi:hypothetical protein NECID01_0736 [Nematocida sp. AWRm77]|nr:hypothetical protein NECID01_0736 [Nematocida sp. AWRm77]